MRRPWDDRRKPLLQKADWHGHIRRLSTPLARVEAGTLWRFDDGRFEAVGDSATGEAVLVPTEAVTLLPVTLPLPTRRRKLEALPFAVEDRIAQPVDAVHLALGPELGERHHHLAAVVAHERMAEWLARLDAEGLEAAALVPDALALPVPDEGWLVDAMAGRALVRTAGGGGFALPVASLAAAWAAAGRPRCVAIGEPLPQAIPHEMAAAGAQALPAATLDLRQGAYARAARPRALPLRRLAAVVVAGLVAHGAIAAVDTLALRGMAARRAAETRALVALAAPGTDTSGDLAATAADLLPAGRPAAPGRLLPLLARVAGALPPGGGPMLSALAFDEAGGTLILDLDVPDPAAAEATRAALVAAGLAARLDGRRLIVSGA